MSEILTVSPLFTCCKGMAIALSSVGQ